MVSKSSLIVAYEPTNTLIITDVLSNIQRLIRILKEIDVTGVGRQISVIPLQHADSAKMAETLTALFLTRGSTKQRATTSRDDTKFVADERTNTVIVLASEVEMARVRQLIDFLYRETPAGEGETVGPTTSNMPIAEDIAKVLQNLPSRGGHLGIRGKGRGRRSRRTAARGKGEHHGRQGHQQPRDHGQQRRLHGGGGSHQETRHPAADGLHRSRGPGGQRSKGLQLRNAMDRGRQYQYRQQTRRRGRRVSGDPTSAIPALTQGVLPQGFSSVSLPKQSILRQCSSTT